MSDGRKKMSGFEYRKRALNKSKKEQEVLSKTPKLDSFFRKKERVTLKSESINIDYTNFYHEGDDVSSTSSSTDIKTDRITTSLPPSNINHEGELQAALSTRTIEEVGRHCDKQ
ncbi:unnamed protein product [Brassicogethes aeneus]|uniref:Uncharacterized protein n=1 Tax=Brassicogethes aeneus TaxID=1431903 RepID=A0A9P0BGM6_BRAAE|nr:unnamed protein product [Brassicogethes aeneus]